jgi:hypothetical protein
MDTTLSIILAVAVVIVIAILAYHFREEIGLKFKGWGVHAALHAKGGTGRNATDNRIVPGGQDDPLRQLDWLLMSRILNFRRGTLSFAFELLRPISCVVSCYFP